MFPTRAMKSFLISTFSYSRAKLILTKNRTKVKDIIDFFQCFHSNRITSSNILYRGFFYSQHCNVHNDISSAAFLNPMLDLQQFVAKPLFAEDMTFQPSEDDIAKAALLFNNTMDLHNKSVTFMGAYRNALEIPDFDLPEVWYIL